MFPIDPTIVGAVITVARLAADGLRSEVLVLALV